MIGLIFVTIAPSQVGLAAGGQLNLILVLVDKIFEIVLMGRYLLPVDGEEIVSFPDLHIIGIEGGIEATLGMASLVDLFKSVQVLLPGSGSSSAPRRATG